MSSFSLSLPLSCTFVADPFSPLRFQLLLTGVVVFCGRGSLLQIAFGLLISIGASLLQQDVKPFRNKSHNGLQSASLAAVWLTLFTGLVLRARGVGEGSKAADALSALVIVTTVGVVVALLTAALFSMRQLKDGDNEEKEDDTVEKAAAAASQARAQASGADLELVTLPPQPQAAVIEQMPDDVFFDNPLFRGQVPPNAEVASHPVAAVAAVQQPSALCAQSPAPPLATAHKDRPVCIRRTRGLSDFSGSNLRLS